jgi:hypothetical protein
MLYQTDEVTKVIEDQLFLVDTKVIGHTISYKELMELPRLLKRNYFDFSSEYVFSGHSEKEPYSRAVGGIDWSKEMIFYNRALSFNKDNAHFSLKNPIVR